MQDIVVVPTYELGLIHLKRHAIVSSGYTARHIYKTAKDLTVDLKALKIPNIPTPSIFGRKDEEWLIIEIGEVQLHLFVDSYRKEQDIVEKWLNPPSEELLDNRRRYEAKLYEKKNFKI
jgi:ribosomal silencing factor RsfS